MMKGRNNNGNYTNPCLTMHQPWASLLVHGIKRVEGRSWPAPIRGRLWIHAASKVPDEATIKAMEDFYREIYAVNGITNLKFPEHYPISRLIGCVEVVGCVRGEELTSWEDVPSGVRLEGLTDFCWLCEQPQKLLVPFEMRGYQKVYNLERKIYEAAVRGLVPVQSPLHVKFLLPNERDLFSLRPGSISMQVKNSKSLVSEESSSLNAAIAGARAATTQFSKKDSIPSQEKGKSLKGTLISEKDDIPSSEVIGKSSEDISTAEISKKNYYIPSAEQVGKFLEDNKLARNSLHQRPNKGTSLSNEKEQFHISELKTSGRRNQTINADINQRQMASPKLFSVALRGVRDSSMLNSLRG